MILENIRDKFEEYHEYLDNTNNTIHDFIFHAKDFLYGLKDNKSIRGLKL